VAPADDAVLVDYVEGAFAESGRFNVRSVSFEDGAFGFEVSQQREVKVAILGKGGVAPGAVDGDAEERGGGGIARVGGGV